MQDQDKVPNVFAESIHAQMLEGLEAAGWPCALADLPALYKGTAALLDQANQKNAALQAEIEKLRSERQDCALLIGRLATRLRAARVGRGTAAGDEDLLAKTTDFLKRKGLVSTLRAARQKLADELASRAEWLPCDCGCPNGRAPKDAVAVTWIRAADLVRRFSL